MAPTVIEGPVSAKRAQYAGPSGLRGLVSNKKTTAIAFFASLGGLVYGCRSGLLEIWPRTHALK